MESCNWSKFALFIHNVWFCQMHLENDTSMDLMMIIEMKLNIRAVFTKLSTRHSICIITFHPHNNFKKKVNEHSYCLSDTHSIPHQVCSKKKDNWSKYTKTTAATTKIKPTKTKLPALMKFTFSHSPEACATVHSDVWAKKSPHVIYLNVIGTVLQWKQIRFVP